jgi:hypothetical protein
MRAVTVRASSHFWIAWSRIAAEQRDESRRARSELLTLPVGGELVLGLEREWHASLVAVAAAAFAIDSFYEEVKSDIPLPQATVSAWQSKGTARASRIIETLKRGFTIGRQASQWTSDLQRLYHLRDTVVHQRPALEPTMEHPSGRTKVAAEMATYSLEEASASVNLALDIISTCLMSPRPRLSQLVQLCQACAQGAATLQALRGAP